jgi:hypothetical protein
MTESEWLASEDPQAMLSYITTAQEGGSWEIDHHRPTDRKLRLFACACCRQVWDQLTDERSRKAVEVAERFADGEATDEELDAASRLAAVWVCAPYAGMVIRNNPRHAGVPDGVQACLLRDIAGNPFSPLAFSTAHGGRLTVGPPVTGPCLHQLAPSWLTKEVACFAQTIYDTRRFDDLPILADALEDAGCDSVEILEHCRQRWPTQNKAPIEWMAYGPHCRGCHVLDLILGKE